MSIQWFPGHMTRAKRQLEEKIKQVDLVIELRDARAVESSANPILLDLIDNKPHIIVLAKKDLAEDNITQAWIAHFKDEDKLCVAVDIHHDNVRHIISNEVNKAMKDEHERQKRRGIRPRATRALVVGIPNVGKSTLINSLAKRKVASTANKPGLTRALKLIKVSDSLEVIDSPGMLWPKFEDEQVGLNLALIGAINEEILPFERLVSEAYPILIEKDRIDFTTKDEHDLILKIATHNNYSINGDADIFRAQQTFIRDLRNGRYGKISWESVDD